MQDPNRRRVILPLSQQQRHQVSLAHREVPAPRTPVSYENVPAPLDPDASGTGGAVVVAVLAMNNILRAYQCPLRPIGVMQFSSSIVIESVFEELGFGLKLVDDAGLVRGKNIAQGGSGLSGAIRPERWEW